MRQGAAFSGTAAVSAPAGGQANARPHRTGPDRAVERRAGLFASLSLEAGAEWKCTYFRPATPLACGCAQLLMVLVPRVHMVVGEE